MQPADVDAIATEILSCMEGRGAGMLRVANCRRLAQLGESTLRVDLSEDSDLRSFVEAAVASTGGVASGRVGNDSLARAYLAGALAFFHIRDRPGGRLNSPDATELAAIQRAHAGKGLVNREGPTLVARLSWAKWRHDVESGGHTQPNRAATSASARAYRDGWSRALARCVAEAAYDPAAVRVCMAKSRHYAWGERVMGTMRESEDYAASVRLQDGEYVERSVERELWQTVTSGSAGGRYLVVGEAGFGKTTLLWSLHQRFEAEPDVVAFFVSAGWIMQPGFGERPTADLVAAIEAVLADGLRPVVLLDTIDLLLHDEAARRTLRNLLGLLAHRRTVVVSACRPQEESLIRGDFKWVRQLDAYDDAELDRALPLLAAAHCPAADLPALSQRVRSATARGLPVADVCRSPLMLRLLFDLSSPAEPELLDMDVTGLFGQYWERRVVRDARQEQALDMRANPAENLSSVAGWLAVGLLSRGVVELPEEILHQAGMEASGGVITPGELGSGIDVLLARGVLRYSGGLVGFLHQTMFEYAAARGLQAAGLSSRLTVMADRVIYGGDLFVGAVLEQALILAGEDPAAEPVAAETVVRLCQAPNAAIEAIAAVAWAHHHRVAGQVVEPGLSLAGLARATRVIPTVASKSASEAVSQLLMLWDKTDSAYLRATVLTSLARIAMSEPYSVLGMR